MHWLGRAGYVSRGGVYALIAYYALRAGLNGDQLRDPDAVLRALPAMIAGSLLVLIMAGAWLPLRAGAWSRRWPMPTGTDAAPRVSRGAIFVAMAGFGLLAAWRADPSQAKGMPELLRWLEHFEPRDQICFALALGLSAFALYSTLQGVLRKPPRVECGRRTA